MNMQKSALSKAHKAAISQKRERPEVLRKLQCFNNDADGDKKRRRNRNSIVIPALQRLLDDCERTGKKLSITSPYRNFGWRIVIGSRLAGEGPTPVDAFRAALREEVEG